MDEALKLWYNLRVKSLEDDLFMSHPKNWQLMARAIADKELLEELQKRQQTTKLPLKEVIYKTSLPEINVVAENTNTRKFKLSNPEWTIQETKEIERPDDLHYSSGIGLQSGVLAKNLSNGVGFTMMALTAPVAVGAGLGAAPAYTSIFPATTAGTSATAAGSAAAHTPLLPIAIGGGAAAMSSCSGKDCNEPDFGDVGGIRSIDLAMSLDPVPGSKIVNYYASKYDLPVLKIHSMYDKETDTYHNDTTYDQWGRMQIDYAPGTFNTGKDTNNKGLVVSPTTDVFPNYAFVYYNTKNGEFGPDSIAKISYYAGRGVNVPEKFGIDPYFFNRRKGALKEKDVSKKLTHTEFVNTLVK